LYFAAFCDILKRCARHGCVAEIFMKNALLLSLLATGFVAQAAAQDARVYRCPGNEYINNARDAEVRGCKLVEGGNITIVQGTRPATPGLRVAAAGPSPGQRVESGEQRARDSDSRAILESELRKAQALQAELIKEYNNGDPEKRGDENRNYQKYLDRVAELKASIARNEADISGISREISRLGASSAPASTAK
jgi:hypothetical protein